MKTFYSILLCTLFFLKTGFPIHNNLEILSLIPLPTNNFTAGQKDLWQVVMVVQNSGLENIIINFSPSKTFIEFFSGPTNITSEYSILQPIALSNSETDTLVSQSIDTLKFVINQTGNTIGTISIVGRIEGVETYSKISVNDETSIHQFAWVEITPNLNVDECSDTNAGFFNYPNPFGTTDKNRTFFSYTITEPTDVTIRIYTLFGKLVRVLRKTNVQPGRYCRWNEGLEWDGTNGTGDDVLNGVYIAILTTNLNKAVTKIAVAK